MQLQPALRFGLIRRLDFNLQPSPEGVPRPLFNAGQKRNVGQAIGAQYTPVEGAPTILKDDGVNKPVVFSDPDRNFYVAFNDPSNRDATNAAAAMLDTTAGFVAQNAGRISPLNVEVTPGFASGGGDTFVLRFATQDPSNQSLPIQGEVPGRALSF